MNIVLICQIIFSLSVFGTLFIFLRNLPALIEFEPQLIPREKKLSHRFKKSYSLVKEKSGEKFHRLREKNLHRLRVRTLKVDNFLTSYLKRIQETKLRQKKKEKSKSEPKDEPK